MDSFLLRDAVRNSSNEALLREFYPDNAAQVLREHSGSLRSIFENPPQSSTASNLKLIAANELVRRAQLEGLMSNRLDLQNSRIVHKYLIAHFTGCQEERFVALWLDCWMGLIAVDELFRGTLEGVSVPLRIVVRCAIARNAASVIFAHNHPSSPEIPSREDKALTIRLKRSLECVEVTMMDHFIVSESRITSLLTEHCLFG